MSITFQDKLVPTEPSLFLALPIKSTYKQMAYAISLQLVTQPNKLKFFMSKWYLIPCLVGGNVDSMICWLLMFVRSLGIAVTQVWKIINKKEEKIVEDKLQIKVKADVMVDCVENLF